MECKTLKAMVYDPRMVTRWLDITIKPSDRTLFSGVINQTNSDKEEKNMR